MRTPTNAATASRTSLWVDATFALAWKGKPTGIQRVVANLVGEWLRQPGLRLRLCRLDAEGQQFVEVSRDEWRAGLARQEAISPGADSAARPGALEAGYAPLKSILRAWRQRLGQALPSGPTTSTVPVPPAPMSPGDVLATLDGSWMIPNYHQVLRRTRESCSLRLLTLVHDLIPCKFPQYFGPGLAPAYWAWAVEVLRSSDLIATDSENSRRDLEWFGRQVGLPGPPVQVLRCGDDFCASEQATEPRVPGQALGDGQAFVLAVGTLEIRKNYHLLYHVWRRLVERHGATAPLLVLVGRPGWLGQDLLYQIEADPLVRTRIVVLPSTSDAELAWLYRECLFTMYPSHYEGWGLPVAESLARGKFCIASGTSSMPEIGGDLVDYHDPLDVPGCADLVARAAFDRAWRIERETRIRLRYRTTTWKQCADRFLAVLQQQFGALGAGAAWEEAVA